MSSAIKIIYFLMLIKDSCLTQMVLSESTVYVYGSGLSCIYCVDRDKILPIIKHSNSPKTKIRRMFIK